MSFSDKFIRRNSLAIANKKFNKFFKQRAPSLYDFKSKDKKKKKLNKKIEKIFTKNKIQEPLKKKNNNNSLYTKEKNVKFRIDKNKNHIKLIFNPKKKLFDKKNKIKEKIHEPEVLLIIRYKIIFLYLFINILSFCTNLFFYLNTDERINENFAELVLIILILSTLMRVMILKFLDYKNCLISFIYNLFHLFFWICIHLFLSKIKRHI